MSKTITLTLSTRLSNRTSKEILDYLRDFRTFYGHIFRTVWKYVNKTKCVFNISSYNTHLQHTFGILKRIANSIIKDAIGKYKAIAQRRLYDKQRLSYKLDFIRQRIIFYNKILIDKQLKEKVTNNTATGKELQRYRNIKHKLYYLRQTMNHINNQLANIQKEIDAKQYKYCFGTQQLYRLQSHDKKFYAHFQQQRNANILYIGAKNETNCNQMLQLTKIGNVYHIQLRTHDKTRKYVNGYCSFKYMEHILANELINKSHGISYRFHFNGNKCYLQAILTLPFAKYITTGDNGYIGIDFNTNCIAITETNKDGNIMHTNMFQYTNATLNHALQHITNYAITKKKNIAIEQLRFCKQKSNTASNTFLKHFAYAKYTRRMRLLCATKGIQLSEITPAYTTQIAKTKYCYQRKLTAHQGAAYVIARLAQNLQP